MHSLFKPFKVDGMELVDKIHKLTQIDIRVPTGYLGNYKFSNNF